jgi:two-component sensor histidine kinase
VIGIEIHPDDECMEMIISDNGVGFFEIIDFDKVDTLGLQLVKTLVGEIGGKIELKEHDGTKFRIKFSNSQLK